MSYFQRAFWHAAVRVMSLPFTEYLMGTHAPTFILTLCLQGRNNFPHFADEQTEPPGR